MSAGYRRFLQCVRERIPAALVSVLAEDTAARHMAVDDRARQTGSLGSEELDAVAYRMGREALHRGQSLRTHVDLGPERLDLFIDVQWPRGHLIIIGAVHIAIPLVSIAQVLGFYTTVIDSRRAFATAQRFPHADELRAEWPEDALGRIPLGPSSYLVFLSHDDKLDYPALKLVLGRNLPYIGALGSRRTHARRRAALQAEGVAEAWLDRIHAPVGLDIGARTPEEIALAVMAEIVRVRNQARA